MRRALVLLNHSLRRTVAFSAAELAPSNVAMLHAIKSYPKLRILGVQILSQEHS